MTIKSEELDRQTRAKETQTHKAATKQVKTTKGKIKDFDRATWNYMQKQLHLTQRELTGLREVWCPAKVNGANANVIRYFTRDVEAEEKGVAITDYESLNTHPELILYEGYKVMGKRGELIVKKREGAGVSFLEEKIKQGVITEVGVVIPKTAKEKWLGGFGNFIMMGGFLLVLVIIIVIVGLISWLVKC